jgi:hypothetical protein
MKLVMVHGRNQQGKNPAQLQQEWETALKTGLQKQGLHLPAELEISFPFYGDRLGGFAAQWDIPLSEDITAKGGNVDAEYLKFRAELVEAMRQRAGITQAQVDAEYGDNPKPKGPQNWEWVQAILRALDKHAPGMSETTVDVFTRDVFLYIKRMGVRDVIDNIVAQALATEPTVLVGHSLGTVVTYSVLQRDPRPLKVPLYVTLGSPLGVRAIRNELRPLKFPPPVSAWYNAYDERDVVALYPLDATHFPVQPPIENNKFIHNIPKDPHSISGYLSDAAIARRIYDALSSG